MNKQVVKSNTKGNMLIFLSGKNEIYLLKKMFSAFINSKNRKKIKFFTMFSSFFNYYNFKVWLLFIKKQTFVKNTLNIFLSTNLCETSITLKNLKYIIDTGITKVKIFNPKKSSSFLKILLISKLQAKQRSGRIGKIQLKLY